MVWQRLKSTARTLQALSGGARPDSVKFTTYWCPSQWTTACPESPDRKLAVADWSPKGWDAARQ